MEDQGAGEVKIQRVSNDRRVAEKDLVAREVPLTIFFNEKELVTLLCSPLHLKYLALGFLRAEGLINGLDNVEKITLHQERKIVYVNTKERSDLAETLYGKRTITSGCGKGTVFFHALDSLLSKNVVSGLKIKAERLLALMRALQQRAVLFKATGGVHSAGLADAEQILVYQEDIGRHNAIDKLVGECLVKNISLRDKILLSSGRLSAEVVLKGAKIGLPLIVSRSAATSLAVELAEEAGITLVGFVRGGRFNIYTHGERIL